MSEFTKEEISLCKQVAERHGKAIKYGDWYWSKSHNKLLLAMDGGFEINEQEFMGVFKIWTISDCLEFLRKAGFNCFHVDFDGDDVTLTIDNSRDGTTGKLYYFKTPLEVCLKAVLTVLEEEGK